MKRNYSVVFIMLFVVSIAGGLALNNVFDYSMTVGVCLGLIFLVCAAFFVGKSQNNSQSR